MLVCGEGGVWKSSSVSVMCECTAAPSMSLVLKAFDFSTHLQPYQSTVETAQSLFCSSLTNLQPQPCVYFTLRSNTIKLNHPAVPARVDLDWRRCILWGLRCGLYSFVLPPSFWTWLMVWVMKGCSTHTMTLTQSLHESIHQFLGVKPHSCFCVWHTLSVALLQCALRIFRLVIMTSMNTSWWSCS